jgi:hypothetical protein
MSMPLYPDRGGSNAQRHPGRSKSAEFPEDFLGRKPAVPAPKKQP